MEVESEKDSPLVFQLDPVLSSIFRNLSAKELNSVAQVCSLWNRKAQIIKRKRQQIFWTYFPEKIGSATDCCHYKTSPEDLSLQLKLAESEPTLALAFCTRKMHQGPFTHFQDQLCAGVKRKLNSYGPKGIQTLLEQALPDKCDYALCTAPGIIGTFPNNSGVEEIMDVPALTTLFFPPITGVTIHRFPVSGIPVDDSLNMRSHTNVPEDTPVKCLLIFLYDRVLLSKTVANSIMLHYITEQKGHIAVGGAIVHNMTFPKYKVPRRNQSYGIAFTGENIEAASVTIDEEVRTRRDIKARLEMLGKKINLDGQCIGFKLICIGRVTGSLESKIFRELYPSVPLFGVFGLGEIGFDSLHGADKIEQIELDKLHLTYSSVFVMLSFKKK